MNTRAWLLAVLLLALPGVVCAQAGGTQTTPGTHSTADSSLDRQAAQAELSRIEQRIDDLKRQRRLQAPIVVTALPVAVGLVMALTTFGYWGMSKLEGVSELENALTPTEKQFLRRAGISSALGFVAAAPGVFWLQARLRARRATGPEYKGLLERWQKVAPLVSASGSAEGFALQLRASL